MRTIVTVYGAYGDSHQKLWTFTRNGPIVTEERRDGALVVRPEAEGRSLAIFREGVWGWFSKEIEEETNGAA